MRYRQVHLDFHTSEKIQNIGEKFNKKEFQRALITGHVDSITLFSKCHHGWSYHPTRVNKMHPGLNFDLLGEQIEAAHEIGVKTPVYISAGIDEKYVLKHKEYCVRNKDQSTTWAPDFETPGYHKICMNTPYLDLLLEQTKEVLKNYDADGLFFDIANVQPCYCTTCINQLIKEGKNPDDDSNVIELAERVYANYTKRIRETVDSICPGLPVFHNGGHIRRGRRDLAYANSHLELESLPTGGWGYDHFPVSASYARTLGMEYCGMTGKFHTSWGEFGGFKHPNALRYEVALSFANGAVSSVGDQLHPSGMVDMATYELIGKAYAELEEKEQYQQGFQNIADIGVFSTEAIDNYYESKNFSSGVSSEIGKSDKGCARILLEGKYLFNYIDDRENFDKYKLIILPDSIVLDEYLEKKFSEYVKKGGKILASGKSATKKDGKFSFDFGCEFDGENDFNPDYVRPLFELKSISSSAYVVYSKGYKLKNVTGKVMANRENPYFNRTVEHFSSHKHTPNNPKDSHPAIVNGNDGAYIGWDIFNEYAQMGSIIVKEIVCHVIDEILKGKSLKTNLPAQGVVTLMKKGENKIVHLLYASPVKRGENIEIIEDIIPIHNTSVSVLIDNKVKSVCLLPQNKELEFEQKNGYVSFNVDEFKCHQMIKITVNEG